MQILPRIRIEALVTCLTRCSQALRVAQRVPLLTVVHIKYTYYQIVIQYRLYNSYVQPHHCAAILYKLFTTRLVGACVQL